jgi:hypothetical protein
MEGWIKLHRKITEWEWYTTPNMFQLFLHLLLTVNYEDDRWEGMTIKRGQRIFGYRKLSQETGISIQSIRTCLKRLKSTQEVTIKSTRKYSLITICKYEEYQINEKECNTQTNTQTNTQLTHNQHNLKNIRSKEVKKINPANEIISFERTKFNSPVSEKKTPPIKPAKVISISSEIVRIFMEEHGDYKIVSRKKEEVFARKILAEYKKVHPDAQFKEILEGLRIYFRQCVHINDPWKRDNMSLGLIVAKFNEINKIIKNGSSGSKQGGATQDELKAIIAKHSIN